MATIDDLKKVLEMEVELAEALGKSIAKEHQAIIAFDGDALMTCTGHEEELIRALGSIEQERVRCSKEIFTAPAGSGQLDSPTLEDAAGLLGSRDASAVAALHSRLRTAARNVLDLNMQNRTLLQHSLNFVRETLRIITSGHTRQIVDQKM